MPKIAIIIGAGPAGLTAAYELVTKTDIQPVILEKSIPQKFEYELEQIPDRNIPSNFEGFPLTLFDIYNHISCLSKV